MVVRKKDESEREKIGERKKWRKGERQCERDEVTRVKKLKDLEGKK